MRQQISGLGRATSGRPVPNRGLKPNRQRRWPGGNPLGASTVRDELVVARARYRGGSSGDQDRQDDDDEDEDDCQVPRTRTRRGVRERSV